MSSAYRIELETRARKEFLELPRDAKRLLSAVIEDLAADPRPPASKKLLGVDGYRVRKGDYRILYSIDGPKKMIRIFRIGRRRDVYRRLR